MFLTFSHIQKDDSLVPLLPYATGCFLASVLLTISGIAETHPQALALATYLIQFGWLLLQIQGVMLVYMFGSQGQGGWLFRVWLVSMQVLDVHRRFLSAYLGAAASLTGLNGEGLNGTSVFGSLAAGGSGLSSRHGADGGGGATFGVLSLEQESSSMIGQQHSAGDEAMLLQGVIASVWGYYTGMLCTTGPASICDLIASSSSSSSVSVLAFLSTLAHAATTATTTTATVKAASMSHSHATYSTPYTGSSKTSPSSSSPSSTGGMKEMENLVVFEILAGVGVSGLMCLVWAAMAIRRGGLVAIPGVRRTRIRMQRWGKTVKGLRDEWWVGFGGLERKVDAFVEQMKFRVES
ncbi:hypothetical protein KI688_008752 [Linnemannia hyalina]|uniref:Uncharacterized protein n=1 Tax=Linnemannia hyalina TaxID=64524 RepID=A0A9P7Y1V3_9FUNG|nr:hypothetical protein KI688_008752 [Linnemannia hyalina]